MNELSYSANVVNVLMSHENSIYVCWRESSDPKLLTDGPIRKTDVYENGSVPTTVNKSAIALTT
jgi:hypothetical protein